MDKPKRVKTGGRVKGSVNKSKLRMMRAGITPLDYMLKRLRDDKIDDAVRADMAKAAAPYCHPRLAAIEHTGKDGGPLQVQISAADSKVL